jgi:hypothetical protein
MPQTARQLSFLTPVKYRGVMTAQPITEHPDPLDPRDILRSLPEREHAGFLAAYREAMDGARDPAGWPHLQRTLKAWRCIAIAAARPGFYEAQEAARRPVSGGMLLDDYLVMRRGT